MSLRPRGLPPSQWAVLQLPLDELWDDSGPLPLTRRRAVGRAEIADLLRAGPVRFVVADLASGLTWVPAAGGYRFWKDEVKAHLVEPADAGAGFRLEDDPGGYCYLAAEWSDGSASVVVLETHH
ncbi:MAG: hypothetical protein K2X82_08840 [Gemmataceae bacterium]|nr:hypothetical protein [Gemmataceae bacterium]